MTDFTRSSDPRLDEIGLHLRAAVARRRSRVRRRLTSAIVASMAAAAVGALTRDGSDARAAEVVARAQAAATHVPSGGTTMLHVVTRLGDGPGGMMEVWEAGRRFRRVGYHTDGSIHAEETLHPLPSGDYEYRAFQREPEGDVIRVAKNSRPECLRDRSRRPGR